MNMLHLAIPTHKQSSRPGIQVHRLRDLLPHLSRCARDQVSIRNMILLDERMHSRQIVLLLGFLEIERHDLQPLIVILRIELDQILCFVVAVRAPRPGHDSQHDLILKLRILI